MNEPSPSPEPPSAAADTASGTVPLWSVAAAALGALVLGLVGGQALFGDTSEAADPPDLTADATSVDTTTTTTAATTTTTTTVATTTAPTTTASTTPARVAEPGDWDMPLPLDTPATTPELEIVVNSIDFGSHDAAMAAHPAHVERVPEGHRILLVDATVTNTGGESYQGAAMAQIFALGSSRRVHGRCGLISFPGQMGSDMVEPGASMSGTHAVCVPEDEIADQSLTILIDIYFADGPTFRTPDWASATDEGA